MLLYLYLYIHFFSGKFWDAGWKDEPQVFFGQRTEWNPVIILEANLKTNLGLEWSQPSKLTSKSNTSYKIRTIYPPNPLKIHAVIAPTLRETKSDFWWLGKGKLPRRTVPKEAVLFVQEVWYRCCGGSFWKIQIFASEQSIGCLDEIGDVTCHKTPLSGCCFCMFFCQDFCPKKSP